MAKQVATQAAQPGVFSRLQGFYEEVKVEMSKVTWPTKEELKGQTLVVMLMLLIFAVVIGIFDKICEVVIMQLLALV